MASDFDNIRAGMQTREDESSSGQAMFIAALIGVLIIGAGIGYLLLPRSSAAPVTSSPTQSAQVTAQPQQHSKSELKQMRRAAMKMFMETQSELLSCAQTQRHMSNVYQAYSARNLPKYQAWNDLLFNNQKLSKLGQDMNQFEAQAYVLTGGMQNDVREVFGDINMQLGATSKKIDPVKCGQLNAAVQRRQRDLEMPPKH